MSNYVSHKPIDNINNINYSHVQRPGMFTNITQKANFKLYDILLNLDKYQTQQIRVKTKKSETFPGAANAPVIMVADDMLRKINSVKHQRHTGMEVYPTIAEHDRYLTWTFDSSSYYVCKSFEFIQVLFVSYAHSQVKFTSVFLNLTGFSPALYFIISK